VSEPLAAILSLLDADGDRSQVRAGFARAVLRRVPDPQLTAADPACVAAALADVFGFVDRRAADDIAIRVVDPPVTLAGTPPAGSVLEVSCEDRQFIVTTVREELHRLGVRVGRMLHPVYGCERGPDGRLTAIVPARTAARRESFLQLELAAPLAPPARQPIVEALHGALCEVFAVTGDYLAMREEVTAAAARTREHAGRRYADDEVAEAVAMLHWMLDGNVVLLGCRRYPAQAPSLGVFSGPSPLRLPAPEAAGSRPLLHVGPTSHLSRVHRQVPLHRFDLAEVDGRGEDAGTFEVVGVFSVKGEGEPAVVTPMLRFKLRRILELEDVVEGSQDEATLVSMFQVLPKEELFEADVPALRETLAGLVAAEEGQDVRVRLRVDAPTRTVSALLSIPQDIYSSALRHRLERFLVTQVDGSRVDSQVTVGERADAILRLVVHVDGPLPRPPLDSLEREVRLLCRTWDEELVGALAARAGDAEARRLGRAWAEWFPRAYRDAVPAAGAVGDVLQLEQLATRDPHDREPTIRVVLERDPRAPDGARLKVFSAGAPVELSRFLPILESLGLWAGEERPYALGPEGGRVHLHDFSVTDPSGEAVDVDRDGERLAGAALALWHGRTELDSLNRLVLRAAIPWEDVAVLRAYHRYRNQLGNGFTTAYVADVLIANPAVTCDLLELFAARFDPVRGASADVVEALHQRVVSACDDVTRLDHDRVLRGLLALVDATLRTNRYLTPDAHLALKFDSAAVPGNRPPVPFREIFVFGPAVEGIHLRWGPVARGGIRWSERPDDYRSEVLGLMRTQVLKNAVIVPTGAKGGFVVKRGRRGGVGRPDVQAAYETFVSCLLDVTDNVVGHQVVPVPRRRDGDDAYLVVAADRGTATFSDLANRISLRRRFWLGDAFASGGSHGYDHKKLGITALGAWVAVRHHLAQIGLDPASEPISVVGIGDMSGDVFGNGMLQSDRIRLIAAFDHRDVFIDPDPDPAVSYQERARLFALPSSSWQDYDRRLISRGGGVWSRLDKRIELSDEARAALGVEDDHLSPPEVIRAILRAPVTLLFAGGIGTFVRASTEPDQAIDDRANAELRVEGTSIRARVVGEGANLAFTQRARIEYARRGGRINTDAIDNSAGVDISDHEVNLKILLRTAIEAGALTVEERDRLLAEVCDEVVASVLRDCAQQSLAVSRAEAASPELLEASEMLMAELEAADVLDRAVEALPTPDEMRSRAAARAGLTRPELAVLLAGAKRSLSAELLASAVPDQPALRPTLAGYFPEQLATRFDHLVDHHQLRRELIASRMANEVVNRMGPTFVSRLAAETGTETAAVASAYWAARAVADAPAMWPAIDRVDDPEQARVTIDAARTMTALLEALTRAYLRRGDGVEIASTIERDRPAYAELEAAMPEIGTAKERRLRARRAEAFVDAGADPDVAVRWACLDDLHIAPDVAELARTTGRPVTAVAQGFLRLSEASGIDRLRERLRRTPVTDRWSRAAWQDLADDLDELRRAAAHRAFEEHPGDDELSAVTRFLAARAPGVSRAIALVRDVEHQPEGRLDAVGVATRAVRRALDGGDAPSGLRRPRS
jgi:glutamate dehydrogenase